MAQTKKIILTYVCYDLEHNNITFFGMRILAMFASKDNPRSI